MTMTPTAAEPTGTTALSKASATAAVLFSGLFAGFLTTVLVLELTVRGSDAHVYTQVRLVELAHLDDLATALLLPALLAAVVLTATVIRRRGRWLALAAVTLLLATLLISVSISVPINTAQQGWSVLTPPGDWSQVRDRWQLAHAARTITAVLAFVLLTATLVPRRRPTASPPLPSDVNPHR